MRPTHATRFIEHKDCRPGFDLICAPRFVIIIRDYRITNAQRGNLTPHVFDLLFTGKLGRVHANNRQPLITVAFVPALYERQCVAAVVAAKRPELHQHDATAQIPECQWF